MARGDHFFVWRQHKGVPFQHHGIDLGDGTVVHFTDGSGGVAGPGGSAENFQILRTSIEQVTRGGRDVLHVVDHPHRLATDLIVRRALSQIGRQGYHLIFDNCEHFACWCVVDRHESRQVNVACQRAGAVGVKVGVAAAVRAASKVAASKVLRSASPWLLVADAAQLATEACGHHVGLTDPEKRKQTGRFVGGVTALGVGSLGGPVGLAVAGGIWAAGELAGEVSRKTYEQFRLQRQ